MMPTARIWLFFASVFVWSTPFWALGVLADTVSECLPLRLPVSALMFVCPLLAAVFVLRSGHQRGAMRTLLRRTVAARPGRTPWWYVPALLLMPGVLVLSYALMRWKGTAAPAATVDLRLLPVLVAAFLVAAACEEAGWTAYATDALQQRFSALVTALLVGAVWAVWHVVPYLQAGRSAAWIGWQCVATVALRLLIVWLYNTTGSSVAVACLFHAMINVSTAVFPANGSHYDPAVTGPVLVVSAFVVTFLWGPATLARYRYTRA
ncbi:CPBP family intramembrane glutamic endopeptidase [Cryptosporangium sp. NPDC048952]|uniref:CPBP family intramembrane glutamic endopeptidase n=1 Tax=Cryptosporangium sp. NPDC048952 TaxID=3363961 RepID=UPI0037205D42